MKKLNRNLLVSISNNPGQRLYRNDDDERVENLLRLFLASIHKKFEARSKFRFKILDRVNYLIVPKVVLTNVTERLTSTTLKEIDLTKSGTDTQQIVLAMSISIPRIRFLAKIVEYKNSHNSKINRAKTSCI